MEKSEKNGMENLTICQLNKTVTTINFNNEGLLVKIYSAQSGVSFNRCNDDDDDDDGGGSSTTWLKDLGLFFAIFKSICNNVYVVCMQLVLLLQHPPTVDHC